jgi:hypothetical protein
VGSHVFDKAGWQTTGWNLSPGAEGSVDVEFRVSPEFRPATDPRVLGIAIVAFGFKP